MAEQRLRRIARLARWSLALVFLWHGLVPKLLWLSPDELAMIAAHGPALQALAAPATLAQLAGWAEVGLAVLLIFPWRWPLLLAGLALLLLLVDVALFSPHLLIQAFNPLSTNLAALALALALCLVAWLAETPATAAVQTH